MLVHRMFYCRNKNSERLYVLHDPNWNVVAIADSSAVVQERYTYSAFGKLNIFDAAFNVRSTSACNVTRTFTGQVLDAETGLMLYRNRGYHPTLGRFIRRDPVKYIANDMNLYRYARNSSQQYTDKYGLDITVETGVADGWWDPVNNTFHKQLCIDTWEDCDTDCPKKTGKKCFSYRQCGNNPLAGETYQPDPVSNAGIYQKKQTTCQEDMDYISQLENDQFRGWYYFTTNCRHYSQMVFDEAPGTEMKYKCIKWESTTVYYPPSISGVGGYYRTVTRCVKWDWVEEEK